MRISDWSSDVCSSGLSNASGLDEGETYTGTGLPLFEDLGSLPAVKIGKMGRAMVRANGAISGRVAMHVDYDMTMPSPPDASGIAGDNVWDSGKWGSSSWGDVTPSSITQQWESLSGLGYTCRSEEHTSELQSLMRT